jgi:hypothetical protein
VGAVAFAVVVPLLLPLANQLWAQAIRRIVRLAFKRHNPPDLAAALLDGGGGGLNVLVAVGQPAR